MFWYSLGGRKNTKIQFLFSLILLFSWQYSRALSICFSINTWKVGAVYLWRLIVVSLCFVTRQIQLWSNNYFTPQLSDKFSSFVTNLRCYTICDLVFSFTLICEKPLFIFTNLGKHYYYGVSFLFQRKKKKGDKKGREERVRYSSAQIHVTSFHSTQSSFSCSSAKI